MNIFKWGRRRGSAPIARDRLKVLLAHERILGGNSDLLVVLRDEILAVIYRHVMIKPERVHIRMNRGEAVSMLAVQVEVPMFRSNAAH